MGQSYSRIWMIGQNDFQRIKILISHFKGLLAVAVSLCLVGYAGASDSGNIMPPDSTEHPVQNQADSTQPLKASEALTTISPSNLDTNYVHQLYLDGNFDDAIRILQAALDSSISVSHADSVFIFKHLGVMYAADPGTREMGKRNMYLLLAVEPTARIMDMYASDMIYMIFKNIQDEFTYKHLASIKSSDTSLTVKEQHSESAPKPGKAPEVKPWYQRNSGFLFGGGGVVIVGAVAVIIVVIESNPSPNKKVYAIN